MPNRSMPRTAAAVLSMLASVAVIAAAKPAGADVPGVVTVDLTAALNNDGISAAANFDGSGYGYPAAELPAAGTVTLDGIAYRWPASAGPDNVAATGQRLSVTQGNYDAVNLLVASSYGPVSGNIVLSYSDGSSGTTAVTVPDWYSGGNGVLNTSHRDTPGGGSENHPVHVYALAVPADAARTLVALNLPGTAAPAPNVASLHVFAVTLVPPVTVDLGSARTNDGVADPGTGNGNFDGSGYAYPANLMPTGRTVIGGAPFQLTGVSGTAMNNAPAVGQQITVPAGRYAQANLLVAGTYGAAGGNAALHYADGSTGTVMMSAPDWYGSAGQLSLPYRYGPGGSTDNHPVSLFVVTVPVDRTRTLSSITLPNTAQPAPNVPSLHVFALTLRAGGTGPSITDVRSTTRRNPAGQQLVAVTVRNDGDAWVLPSSAITVRVTGSGVDTATPAVISHLGPGEEARVTVGITGTVPAGTNVTSTVTAATPAGTAASRTATLKVGIPAYTATGASIGEHESPDWFNDGKFGIFIHWGVYSVPAWAPVGQSYAEWYWNAMNNTGSPTYNHHRDTYGTAFNYDDFIPQFTAANYNPRAWVDLIAGSGAQYFVLTSKHHDGFALYDSAVSGRDAVDLGPHRDLVGELFNAARTYQPGLHPGLYFSMPEWYNPDNPWYGHAPRNPYTGAAVPYTGYTAGRDYVRDYQAPQMLEIIRQYSPEVIWCDIGGVNDSHRVLAEYLNRAEANGQQVTFNNRCGIGEHDFTTPEYSSYNQLVVAKWEASRGLDPFSYGYNAATPDSAYMSTDDVVHTLVDTVSKNGNFLLDIGPAADGSIPAIMAQRLRETGTWMAVNGESIHGTTYWLPAQREGDLRFAVKQNEAFYITSLTRPGNQVVVNSPVPVHTGDRITMLGYSGALSWTKNTNGQLVIDVPSAAAAAGNHAWVFKVTWSN